MSEHKRKAKLANTAPAKSSKSVDRAVTALTWLKSFSQYDPYSVFDTRRGCKMAIAGCSFLVVIAILEGVVNGGWLFLVFVPIYGLVIRNRLQRLKTLNDQPTERSK